MTDFATPETGLVGVAVLLALLLLGLPIGAALGLVGIGGLVVVLGLEPALIKAGVVAMETLVKYELGTLPLFLLMAQLFFSANASRDLFEFLTTVGIHAQQMADAFFARFRRVKSGGVGA